MSQKTPVPEREPTWQGAVSALARRVLGTLGEQVTFADKSGSGRAFGFEARSGQLTVHATDAGSAAVGLHEYLRRHGGMMVSWDHQRPSPPSHLPDAPHTEGAAQVEETYYLNFCTFGYTTTWWDWEQWEREIDWMALRGVTAPLMIVGHEAVLERVFLDEGLSPDSVADFLSGPAYLPWLAMGTLDGFAGPLPTGWIPTHRELAGRILGRQRELGMRPILPAFTGHVPAELAGGEGARDWQGHRTHVIGPDNPLFRRLTAAMVRTQRELWGTDHRYAADPFIEMVPVDDDPGYPGRVATALLDGLTDADPEAAWYLQTWPFSYQSEFWTEARVRTFLDAIPPERLVLLDLFAETEPQWKRFDGFAHRSWMWCALLNFGGRSDPIADLTGVAATLEEALSSAHPPTGIGLSMEATRVAPAYFERVLDLVWQDSFPLEDWLEQWVSQRYQVADEKLSAQAVTAWQGLAATTLASGDYFIFPEAFTGLVTERPSARIFADAGQLARDTAELLWYEPRTLTDAWNDLLTVAEAEPGRVAGPLGRDLIEVALAVLPRHAELCFLAGYDADGVREPDAAASFFTVFDDLEELLATRPEFRYDTWENEALRWAETAADRGLLVDNARRLLTVWGESGDGHLDDYAARLWAGLIGYYRNRWQIWAELHPVTPCTEDDLENAIQAEEKAFLRDGPTIPSFGGDTVAVSRRLYDAYADPFVTRATAARIALGAQSNIQESGEHQ